MYGKVTRGLTNKWLTIENSIAGFVSGYTFRIVP